MAETLVIVLLGVVAAYGSWSDLRFRKIPNWLCLVNMGLGLAWVTYASGPSGAGYAGLHIAVSLLAGMALTALGVIGAGDAKFYASMAAWLTLDRAIWLLVSVALAGLVLLLAFVLWRFTSRAKSPPDEHSDFAQLPYGVAIGAGGLIAIGLA